MTQTEALKLALEAFERMNHEDSIFVGEFDDQITAIREALAQPEQDYLAGVPPMLPQMRDGETIVATQPEKEDYPVYDGYIKKYLKEPEQEPVAWMFDWDVYDPTNSGPDFFRTKPDDGKDWKPLDTTPQPQREWVGLDGVEIGLVLTAQPNGEHMNLHWFYNAVQAIEAKLKEKNT
jgi:hypothetical protein